MAQTNVSSCVLSIIASFTSGLDVFKKFREARGKKKRRAKRGDASAEEEELRLARSLRQGPEDIGREYQRNIHSIGEAFALGDVAAQTSLAEILLKLNTGLVTIINTFLTKDKRDAQLDYQSLLSLSERSRVDTCRTLRQLYRRMMQARLPLPVRSSENARESRSAIGSKSAGDKVEKATATSKHAKVKGPMLARVVIADSSKPSQVAMVRPGMRKKKSNISSNSLSSKTQSNASLPLPLPGGSPPPAYTPKLPERPTNPRSKTNPTGSRPRRKQSAAQLSHGRESSSNVAIRPSQSTPRLQTTILEHEPLPLIPSSAPLPAFEPRRRKPTPTYYSIESASTKLGEIPMHKWAEPYDFDQAARLNKEAEMNGWPLVNVENVQLRKRRGFFHFFRRRDS